MRLTNNLREAFVRAALDDVPQVDYTEQIRKAVTDDAVAQLPASVRAVWKDPKTRDFINTSHQHVGGRDTGYVTIEVPGVDRDSFLLTEVARATVEDMLAKRSAQEKLREDLKRKLKAAAYSVTTRDALAKLLPEFEKYLPADEGKATAVNLPAIANLVADFTRAGWPKNATRSS